MNHELLKVKMIERYPTEPKKPKSNNIYVILGSITLICLIPFIKNPVINKLKINNLIYISLLIIFNLLILCLLK